MEKNVEKDNEIDVKVQMRAMMNDVTPKKLYDYLNQYVIGQDEAKKYVSVAVYNHYKRFMDNIYGYTKDMEKNPYSDIEIEKSNAIVLGPTGTGKTYMFKILSRYLNIPFHVADCTSLSETGYVGDDVENVVLGALRDCNFNIQATHHAIIVLDEFDKLSRKSENASITRDVGGEGVQQGLLKLIEGSIVSVPPNGGRKHPEQECIQIDTSNILFVGLGAFDGIDKIIEKRLNTKSIGFHSNKQDRLSSDDILSYVTPEDLKKFGLIPELIGRFPVLTHTNQLTEDDLIDILNKSKNSVVKQYQKMLWMDNIKLTFDDDALKLMAKNAIKRKTGARGLRGIMDKVLADIMFDYGGYNEKTVKVNITAAMVESYIGKTELKTIAA